MDLECLDTADQVFDALGGNPGVIEITGAKASAVANWRMVGSFPPKMYVAMTDALRSRGKTAPAPLWRMLEAAQ